MTTCTTDAECRDACRAMAVKVRRDAVTYCRKNLDHAERMLSEAVDKCDTFLGNWAYHSVRFWERELAIAESDLRHAEGPQVEDEALPF